MLERVTNSERRTISRARLLTRDLWVMARHLVTGQRGLPNFVILGAQKAGTTSLHSYLSQHPSICPPAFKEIHFFDFYYDKGIQWYRAHFPAVAKLKPDQLTGEATPYYLFHPQAAKRMFSVLPNIKLIALLRNPVDRAISHYYHELRRGKEHLPLKQALAAEESRLAPEIPMMFSDDRYCSIAHQRYSYKSRGIYVRQLRSYLDYFQPDQIHLVCSERFFANTEDAYREVLRFLGCDAEFMPPNLEPKRVGSYSLEQREVVASLQAFFAPYNQELFSLTREYFPQFLHCEKWWRPSFAEHK